MTNKVTVEAIMELLTVQKEFDERVPTRNIGDTTMAYFVELFEWLNTVEHFKNWKTDPGKPKEVQLDELADVLAFALSLLGQVEDELKAETDEDVVGSIAKATVTGVNELSGYVNLENSVMSLGYIRILLTELFTGPVPEMRPEVVAYYLSQPFVIADAYYTFDELIEAYKAKMSHNHARQDGTVDKDKGYV